MFLIQKSVVLAVLAGGWMASGFQQTEPLAVRELAPGVRLEVLELKRVTGELLHLAYAVDNATGEEVDLRVWGIVGGVAPGYHTCPVSVLDLANMKRHLAGNCSSGRNLNVAPNSRREFWSQYQAPPAEVKAMTIQFPDAAPLYDVPIGG